MTSTIHQYPNQISPASPPIDRPMTGRLHSTETCGTVDGPGIRYVVFTQGCPLRCLYCHNPDCRAIGEGELMTVDDLIVDIEKYRVYMEMSGGGVTVSGGEPLLQPEFVAELLRRCQDLGIHTALDTSGYSTLASAKQVLQYTDLVLLDIKSFDPALYTHVTSVSIEPTLAIARYLASINKPTWIRFVLVPNLTDSFENVEDLANFVATLGNVERLEVLPFHQMGAYKWAELGYEYALKDTPMPSPALIERVQIQFRQKGLTVV